MPVGSRNAPRVRAIGVPLAKRLTDGFEREDARSALSLAQAFMPGKRSQMIDFSPLQRAFHSIAFRPSVHSPLPHIPVIG